MKKFKWSNFTVLLYWLLFIALLGLFFANDFRLVDIHKTSIITAVGIDSEGEEVQVTAEVAVPQPSQSGDSIKYTLVQGSGLTIADALNEINSKTGFYPKLQFCKLILVGEGCKDKPLFRLLGCFYRKNYSELTALIAMCKGKASDMLALKSPTTDMTSEAIRNILSDELEKSANTASANLKDIAMSGYSESRASYMPYVEAFVPGTSEKGGDGDSVGGDSSSGGGESGGQQGGSSGGSSGGGGSEGGEQQSGGGSSGGQGSSSEEMQFTARKVAVFSDGNFKGILDDRQSFALCVLKNDIRLAVIPCDADDIHYTLGLKNVDAGLKLKFEDDTPKLLVNFKAKAQVQGARVVVEPSETAKDDVVSESILKGAERELEDRLQSLIESCKQDNVDILGVKELLYKNHTGKYEDFKEDILSRMQVEYEIKIESLN